MTEWPIKDCARCGVKMTALSPFSICVDCREDEMIESFRRLPDQSDKKITIRRPTKEGVGPV